VWVKVHRHFSLDHPKDFKTEREASCLDLTITPFDRTIQLAADLSPKPKSDEANQATCLTPNRPRGTARKARRRHTSAFSQIAGKRKLISPTLAGQEQIVHSLPAQKSKKVTFENHLISRLSQVPSTRPSLSTLPEDQQIIPGINTCLPTPWELVPLAPSADQGKNPGILKQKNSLPRPIPLDQNPKAITASDRKFADAFLDIPKSPRSSENHQREFEQNYPISGLELINYSSEDSSSPHPSDPFSSPIGGIFEGAELLPFPDLLDGPEDDEWREIIQGFDSDDWTFDPA